ncbi:transposase [Neolewinella litorea]|uniref:transposase n=1 Tax=Neolewinella litorea TaxID=2562452 RepID=UPI001FE32397|nr:transposase [Neolewinella litorea]
MAFARKTLAHYTPKQDGVARTLTDNARYNRNELLTTWAAGQRIEFVYLPTYSPNLNLIERLWHFMRVKILNSTYYEKHAEFRAASVTFLEDIKQYKKELRSLLTLNFRTVGGTSVHLSQTTQLPV